MDYDDVVAALFAPRPESTALPGVVTEASPARRLRDAIEPVAMHAVWSRRTNEELAGLGLDFLGAYIGGRAASLGSPVGAVGAAAFAWFEPTLIAGVLESVRSTVDRERLVSVRRDATVASLWSVLGGDDPTEMADLLADVASQADGAGRPLFSGLLAQGRPADPAHCLWWACELLREHRGDSHVAAAVAAGVGPVEMNLLTELWVGMPLLSYTATRGWSGDAMQEAVVRLEERGWLDDHGLTAAAQEIRWAIEDRTDAQEEIIVDALGERLDEVCAWLGGWGEMCIEAGAFPADALKRAAG